MGKNSSLYKQDKLTFTWGGIKYLGYYGPNAISRLNSYIITSLILTAVALPFVPDFKYLFAGEVIVFGLFLGITFYKKNESFYDSTYLLKQSELLTGDNKKGLAKPEELQKLFQPTTKKTYEVDGIVIGTKPKQIKGI